MTRPRFTIGRGMIAVAALALLLALARAAPLLAGYVTFLAASLGAGWGTWRACRRRLGLAFRLNVGLLVLGGGLTLLGLGLGSIATPRWFLAWLVLVAPVIVGAGERWFQASTPQGRAGDLGRDVFMQLMSAVAILLAVPAHLILLGAALTTAFSR